MEKYREALQNTVYWTNELFNRGMLTDAYSQLVGGLNAIGFIAANDMSISVEDYRDLLEAIHAARSAGMERLVNDD